MPALNPTDPLPLLAPIGQPVGDNEGGVQEIYLLPQAALLRDPLRNGLAVLGNLATRAGALWYPLRATLDTASFDQAFTDDRNGGLYTGKLAGFVAEDTPALAAALLRYRGVRLVLLYRDGNGRLKLAGDTTSWYTLNYSLATQATTAARAGYALELAGSQLRPALFYAGTFAVPDVEYVRPSAPATGGTVQVFDGHGTLLRTVQAGQRLIVTGPFRTTLLVQ
ncbi:hypothetical protein [Hymenobacter baengnokdamensis]|uniref:hypothetical protein n=1 Tax=Hymenobacter baengnokdamensis TaxID=2615203 RepID=UPI0012479286|nr:hypothetical protein [Hymenobacter baengnokdamensis]